MPDLSTWANLGEIIAGAAVLIGGGLAVIELRRARHARDQAAARATMDILQRDGFIAAARKVLTLPENADPIEIEQDDEMSQAVSEVGVSFVAFGMHLYTGVSTWNVMAQGNPWLVYQMWVRTHLWVKGSRQVVGPSNFWCYEWLVAQYQQQGLIPAEPAADPEPYRPGDGMESGVPTDG